MKNTRTATEIATHWKILAGCFIGLAFGISSLWFYSLGLFLKPLAAEFGWTRAQASTGPLVGILALGLISPFVGKIIDRSPVRRTALLSMLGLAAAFALLGVLTNGLPAFLCLTFLLVTLGSASSPISFSRILVRTFSRQRGLALGLAIMGTGIGAIATPLLVTRVIAQFGWRHAYLVLAVLVIAAIPIVHLLLKGEGATTPATRVPNGAPGAGALFLTPQFLRLGLIFLLCSLAVFGTVVHIVPMLGDRGMGPAEAASFASAVGVAVILGRLITGALLDRFEANRLGAMLFLLSSLGLWMLFIGGPGFTIAGTLLAGFAIGAELDLAAFLVSKSFPLERYSAAFGGIYTFVSIGGGFGPLIAGASFDRTGSYGAWLAGAALALLAAAAMSVLWKSPVPGAAPVQP